MTHLDQPQPTTTATETKPSKPKSPKSPYRPRRVTYHGLQGCPEYTAWLADFVKHERSTIAQMLDLGLVALAEKRGFHPPPNRIA